MNKYKADQQRNDRMGLQGMNLDKADTLAELLSFKAEKRDIDHLNELKANKTDTENIMDLITTMNRQVSHLIVLLNESLKLNIIKGQDTIQARENRA